MQPWHTSLSGYEMTYQEFRFWSYCTVLSPAIKFAEWVGSIMWLKMQDKLCWCCTENNFPGLCYTIHQLKALQINHFRFFLNEILRWRHTVVMYSGCIDCLHMAWIYHWGHRGHMLNIFYAFYWTLHWKLTEQSDVIKLEWSINTS